MKLELEFLSRASCRVNLEKKEKKAQMGKRKDSVDVVTLKDILNEAGWLRHELAIILLITFFCLNVEKVFLKINIFNLVQFGVISVPVTRMRPVEKWTNSFSLKTYMSLLFNFVVHGVSLCPILVRIKEYGTF